MIYRLSLVKEKKLLLGHEIPPLLRICKQIREEALGIYYAENSFGMLIMNMHFCPFYNWVKKQVPSVLKHIQKLTCYLIGCVGLPAAHQLLRVQEEFLNPNIRVDFDGASDMATAYEHAFALVSMLRKTGLSWDQLADVTKHAQGLVDCKLEDEWHGMEFDEDLVEDMQDEFEPSSQVLIDEQVAWLWGL